MPASYRHIDFKVEDRVGHIVFSRPPLNVFNIEMMREIDAALGTCAQTRRIVALVFQASEGTRAFSAGVAVEEHANETIYEMLDSFHSIFRTLRVLAKPAIAVVDGPALGGGCELVAACDLVIASDRARFGQPEIKLGVFPPVAAIILPQIIGERRARELVLMGELIDARQAYDWGMVSYVVAQGQLQAKTEEILNRFRALSAPVLEMTRRALDIDRGRPFEEALRASEDIYLNELMKTEDAQEGIRAFIEKRKPGWLDK